jgi:hypothetical protein
VPRNAQAALAVAELVIGHADWESRNLRWVNRRLHAVHDWDSVVAQREVTIAGAASAVFTATGAPNTSANLDQSEAFLVAYEQSRGPAWTDEERELAWAAGSWVREFNAKKATLRPVVKRHRRPGSGSNKRFPSGCAERVRERRG